MKLQYLNAAIFAIAAGSVGTINAYNNAMAINHGVFTWNDLTMLVGGLALAAAMISLALPVLWKHAKLGAIFAVVAIATCTLTSLHYTVTRVGGLADSSAGTAVRHNSELSRIADKVKDLTKAKRAECATGYGPKCRGLSGDLKTAEAQLAAIGPRMVVDPAAERFSKAFGGRITADQYRTFLPLVTAGALELVINVLFVIAGMFATIGAASPKVIEAKAVRVEPVHPVLVALRQGAASNRELARRLGWQESRTSKAVSRLRIEGKVHTVQDGRNKVISAV